MFYRFVRLFFGSAFLMEMYLAYLPFLPCFKPREKLYLRLPPCVVACYCFARFVPAYISNVSMDVQTLYSAFRYTAIAALLCISQKICAKGSWWNAIFFGIAAYATQHIFFKFKYSYTYIYRVLNINYAWLNNLSYFLTAAIVLSAIYFFYTRRFAMEENFKVNNAKMVVAGLFLIIAVVLINLVISNETQDFKALSPKMFFAVTVLSILFCVMIIENMFSNAYNKKNEEESEII